jgi:RNA polymerase sigma-70 factor (ECF subfamily)
MSYPPTAVLGRNQVDVQDQTLLDVLPGVFQRTYSYARYLLPPEDAQDATQAALEQVWRNRRKYRDDGTGLPDRWALRVAMNKVRDETRRHRRRSSHVSTVDLEIAVEDGAERRAQSAELQAAINSLPVGDADLIALRYAADLSINDIAETLHRSPGAVAVAIHRAIQRLKSVLQAEGEQR